MLIDLPTSVRIIWFLVLLTFIQNNYSPCIFQYIERISGERYFHRNHMSVQFCSGRSYQFALKAYQLDANTGPKTDGQWANTRWSRKTVGLDVFVRCQSMENYRVIPKKLVCSVYEYFFIYSPSTSSIICFC